MMVDVECKGLIFRVTEKSYFSEKTMTLHKNKTARLLKRKSCATCWVCVIGLEQIKEFSCDDLLSDFNDKEKIKYVVNDAEYGEGEFERV